MNTRGCRQRYLQALRSRVVGRVTGALLNELQRNVFVMLSWDHTSRC